MLLKTLEMQGFKSFPDKTKLNFGKGITAVVGPNGSGKSNISDAVRWVLGETSVKSLRGSKTEDVIFGGTSRRKPLGFAQVVLTLDNSDKTLKNMDDIVTVSRRYYRSGESEYKINGEPVRRKDIHELFMDTGLGADGYSIIGQGKIDSIISAKNDERRELFEEAAGISRFRHKRHDAERRLDQAQENLVRLLDILGELESRVGPLKKQSEKAKSFLTLSEERKNLEIGVWLQKINKITSDLRDREHKIEAAQASYEICENEIESLEKEIDEVTDSVAQTNVKIEELRKSVSDFDESAIHKESDISILKAQLENQKDTVNRLKGEIAASDKEGLSFDSQIEEKNNFIKENDEKIAKKKEELQGVVSELENVRADDEENTKKNLELTKKLSALTMQLSDCRIKASQALSSIEEINSRKENINENLNSLNKEIDDVKAQKVECEENISFIKSRISEYENSSQGYKIKLQTKTDRAEKLRDEADRIQRDLAEKTSRAKMLSDLERNMEGFSGAVKAVMKQSEARALSGIHGTLSQLISVNNEYSTAIEVALGGAMQNIVVDSESDSKRAINFLKNNNKGRVTFLPITAIKPRHLNENDLEANYGFVDIASNLVDCKDEYRDIVENLLGRVIIVEDLDCAIGTSKRYSNKYKIVTLDGQVMNPGGSMTGGSRSRGSGVLSRANNIEKLNAESNKLKAELDEAQNQYKSALEDANKAAADVQGADADLRNANEELIRAQAEDKAIGDKLALLENQKQSMTDENANSDERVNSYKAVQLEAQKEEASVQSEIDATEEEIKTLNSGADEINSLREDIRKRSEKINLELVTLAKDSETAKRSIEDLKLRQSNQSDRIKSINDEISAIESQKDTILLSIENAQKEAQEMRQKSSSANESIKSLIDVRNNLEKSVGEMNAAQKEKTADKEKMSAELVRLEERKNNMQRDYDNLNNMLFEQYELTKSQAEDLGIVIDNVDKANKRLSEIKASIKKLGSINVDAIEEYKEVSKRYEFLKAQTDDVQKSKKELESIISDLTVTMSEKFLTQFNKINEQFKICFADFFGGGKGEIVLEEPDNCLESPIEIKIQPPGKSVQNINLFSGGEKSLAAMALLFSVLKVTPSPFCIYDEVEAALDDVNVERFAKYMRKMTDKTQFISITHRRGTMEEADVLYGVTMQEKGVSKLLELKSAELAAQMGIE